MELPSNVIKDHAAFEGSVGSALIVNSLCATSHLGTTLASNTLLFLHYLLLFFAPFFQFCDNTFVFHLHTQGSSILLQCDYSTWSWKVFSPKLKTWQWWAKGCLWIVHIIGTIPRVFRYLWQQRQVMLRGCVQKPHWSPNSQTYQLQLLWLSFSRNFSLSWNYRR